MRRVLPIVAAVAVAAVLAVGLIQAGGEDPSAPARPASAYDPEAAERAFAAAPAPIKSLFAERGRLLDGGRKAFERRLRELQGTPVVVNKWASWCGPCRAEFPHFQSQAVAHAGQVAFLGIDSNDNRGDATAFLRRFPLPYPSYVDEGERISRAVRAPKAYPATVFVDRRGEIAYVHFGYYKSAEDLERDIRRYALGAA